MALVVTSRERVLSLSIALAVLGGCRDEASSGVVGSSVSPSATGPRSAAQAGHDPILDVRADDPELVAARARARAEIDAVLARHEKSPLPDFSVKAPVTDGIHVEQVWLADVRYEAGFFTGTIDNELARVKTRKPGDVVRVKKEEISDYMYEEGGKLRGNYTLRALLDRLPPEEADAWREKLGPEG
jgi:uncharacterized protein YegJ (DUF2314 family)